MARAGTWPQRGTKTVTHGLPIPSGNCGTGWQFMLARARSCTTGHDEIATITGTGWSCEAVTCGLLIDTLGASGTEQAGLRVTTCGLLAGRKEPQEQSLLIWEWNIQEQQAVVRWRLVDEMLSRQEQRRYWIIWVQMACLYIHWGWKSDAMVTCWSWRWLSD